MNKDKYLEIRKIEKIADNFYIKICKINKFLKDNKDFIKDFDSLEAKEALKTLIEYKKTFGDRMDCFYKLAREEVINHRNGCNHEIVFFDARKGYESYYCPLCRLHIESDDILDNTLMIGVYDIYNLIEPSQGSYLYIVIDYLLENDLDYTKEEFEKALKAVVPNFYYRSCKDSVKVKVKK